MSKKYYWLKLQRDFFKRHDIRIIEGKDKLFISMPSKKVEDKYYDYVHPTVNDLRQELERVILEEYNK